MPHSGYCREKFTDVDFVGRPVRRRRPVPVGETLSSRQILRHVVEDLAGERTGLVRQVSPRASPETLPRVPLQSSDLETIKEAKMSNSRAHPLFFIARRG